MQESGDKGVTEMQTDCAQELAQLEARIASEYGISRVIDKCAIGVPRLAQLVADSFNFHFPASANAQEMFEKLSRVVTYLDGSAIDQDSLPNVIAFRGIVVLKEAGKIVFVPLLSMLIKERNTAHYLARTSLLNYSPNDYEIDTELNQVTPTRTVPTHDAASLTVSPAFRLESHTHDIVSLRGELTDVRQTVRRVKMAVARYSETIGDAADQRDLRVFLCTDPFSTRKDQASVATVAHYKNNKLHCYYFVSKKDDGELVITHTNPFQTHEFPVCEWVDYQVRTSLSNVAPSQYMWYLSRQQRQQQVRFWLNSMKPMAAGAFRIEQPCQEPIVVVYMLTADDVTSATNVELQIRVLYSDKPVGGYNIEVPLPDSIKGAKVHHVTHDAGVEAFWLSFKMADTHVRTHLNVAKVRGFVVYDKGAVTERSGILTNQRDFVPAYGLQLQLDLSNKYEHNAIGLNEMRLEFE